MTELGDLFREIRDAADGTPRIYVPGGPAEPVFLADFLRARPKLADGATFIGLWLPGMNRTDWAGLHPNACAESTFLYGDHRASHDAGKFRLLPLQLTNGLPGHR